MWRKCAEFAEIIKIKQTMMTIIMSLSKEAFYSLIKIKQTMMTIIMSLSKD